MWKSSAVEVQLNFSILYVLRKREFIYILNLFSDQLSGTIFILNCKLGVSLYLSSLDQTRFRHA
jgi:hypothetical protein